MVQATRLMCIFTIALWLMACGPAAPAPAGGGAEAEPTPQAADIAPGVQMRNASVGERGSSQAGSVRSQSPTLELVSEPTATPETVPVPTTEPASTPIATPAPEPTAAAPEPEEKSVHAELYQAVNTIRGTVSEFPLEVDLGLEAAAQIYAESGAGNTGSPRVTDLLFDQGVRCRDMQLRRAPTSRRPAENWGRAAYSVGGDAFARFCRMGKRQRRLRDSSALVDGVANLGHRFPGQQLDPLRLWGGRSSSDRP